MRQGPEFRIVGNASADKKTVERTKLEDAFHEHRASLPPEIREELKRLEYPKSEKEIALINFANEETNRQMEEAGVESFDVPVGNHHVVPPESFAKFGRSRLTIATTDTHWQGIMYNAGEFRSNLVNFGTTAQHETDHLKEYRAFQIDTNDKGALGYRAGVEVNSRRAGSSGRKVLHFRGLNEAIIVVQQKKSFARMLDLPVLAEEKKWLASEEALTRRKKLSDEFKVPEDEFVWVGKTDKDPKLFGYYSQRKTLEYVCNEILEQFPKEYQTTDDVFREFQKARYTGDLIRIGRIVEDTFGHGSFRLLGMMTDEAPRGGDNTIEALKKKRLRQTRTITLPPFLKKAA